MVTAEEYRRVAWDCLKLSEASSNPQTHASLLNLSQYWVRLAKEAERNDEDRLPGYRAKAWECTSRAESVNDPEQRAELLRFAGIWLSLTEPIKEPFRGAYELPRQRAA
jgi:hypothetical protein